MQPFAFGIDGQRIFGELSPQHLCQTPLQGSKHIALLRIRAEYLAARSITRHVAQDEAHEGFCHRKPFDNISDRLRLCTIGS